ncbi:MAG: peptidoglycan-binding domain-containing protein [Patescibacteria group bacterium]
MRNLYIFITFLALVAFSSLTFISPVLAEEEVGFYKEIIKKLEREVSEMETKLSENGVDIDRTLNIEPEKRQEKESEEDKEKENDNNIITTKTTRSSSTQKENEVEILECVNLKRTFRFGDYNEEVIKLQKFLEEKGHFHHPHITKYFGPVTEKAVQDFQAEEGIVSQGTPTTTGFGQVGPKTRKAIEEASCASAGLGSDR